MMDLPTQRNARLSRLMRKLSLSRSVTEPQTVASISLGTPSGQDFSQILSIKRLLCKILCITELLNQASILKRSDDMEHRDRFAAVGLLVRLAVARFVLAVRYDPAGWIDAGNSGAEAIVRCLPTSRRQRLWRSPPPW